MRIKEFRIFRYGPLVDTDRVVLEDFNLFYGMNEEGKSLTIDAIVKLLLSKKSNLRFFEGIVERVDDTPEGYIIIEKEEEEIKFPDAGDITNIADLSPREWRNIFIIRNSDLSISEEERFYTGVTDRLTGLKTEEISTVKNNLKDIGRLTRADSSARLSDSESADKLASRVNDAGELIGKIGVLKSRAEEEGLGEIEKTIQDTKEELAIIESKLSNLEDAARREKYERGLDTLKELKSSLIEIDKLKSYNEDRERNYRDLERDIKVTNEEIEKLKKEVEEKNIELKDIREINLRENRELGKMKERGRIVETEKIDLTRCKELRQLFAKLNSRTVIGQPLLVLFAILFSVSFIASLVKPVMPLMIFPVIFFCLLIYQLIERLKVSIIKSDLDKLLEKVRLDFETIDISADSIEGLLSQIQQFEEGLRRKEERAKDLEGDRTLVEREIDRIKGKIKDFETKRRNFEESIDEIKISSRTEGLKEYRERLNRKQEMENKARERTAILRSIFGAEGIGDKKELVDFWESKVSELSIYKDKSKEIEYNELEERTLKEKREELIKTKDEVNQKYTDWQNALKQIEHDAMEILKTEVFCNTLYELAHVEKRLGEFKSDAERNMENVLDVMRIFEEIEKEEESKVTQLFGKDSKTSSYFSEITGGRYPFVDIDTGEKGVFVYTNDDRKLDLPKLSGGTYDQLYLSIRLALGEEIFQKGFFIMDDPFVKSDYKRLRSQLDVLKLISEKGWQILYFTAKEEVKDVLKNEITDKSVKLIETTWVKL